jgi:sn-glycerol 3-phosphate transport system substrate-binding protein
VAILLSTDMNSLIDNDYVVPLDSFIKGSKEADTYLKDFFPAFLLNSQTADGQTWGAPFQRSTPVLYYNQDLFKAAGLDGSKAPANLDELLTDAKALTKADGSQWGIEIPSDGFPYWLFQGFAIGAGQNLVGDASNKVFFNTPSTVTALQYFIDLQGKNAVMPKGVIKWNDTPTDFTSGKAAMIYYTTGGLTNILANAKFNVGVGFLPAGSKSYGAPTGGGNLYILKSSPAANQAAAWRWVEFLTSPQKQADWTVATGYIASRQTAWDTDTLKKLVAAHSQYGVARDQLKYAAKELGTHRGSDLQQIFGLAVQSALTGDKTAQKALDDAQAAADKILADFPN